MRIEASFPSVARIRGFCSSRALALVGRNVAVAGGIVIEKALLLRGILFSGTTFPVVVPVPPVPPVTLTAVPCGAQSRVSVQDSGRLQEPSHRQVLRVSLYPDLR